MTRILAIHPGDAYSTHDVYTGLVAGLRANGAHVEECRLQDLLQVFSAFVEIVDTNGITAEKPDHYAMAAAPVLAQSVLAGPFDAAIAVTGLKLHPNAVWGLRKLRIKTAVICTESPYQTIGVFPAPGERDMAALYDHVFTNERSARHLFTNNPASRVHYLAHAYNPAVHQPRPARPELACDALFIGTAFPERKLLFGDPGWAGIGLRILGPAWDRPLDMESMGDVVQNADAADHYASAAICLNHHRTTGDPTSLTPSPFPAESLGPRAYELAAVRTFQFCDDSRAELADVFGDTVPTYKAGDAADCQAAVRYWLQHPDAREAAARAQHEAVQGHTWHARAAQILQTIL